MDAVSGSPPSEGVVVPEDLYRRIVQLAPEGIFVLDAAGRVELVNATMAALLGYAAWEMEGRPIQDFLDRHERVGSRVTFAPAEPVRLRELPLRRRDGVPVPARVSLAPLPDGGWTVGVLTDATQINRVQTGLHSAKQFWEQIINSIADCLSVVDPESYRVVGANDRFLAQVGQSAKSVLQKTCYELAAHRDSPCEVYGVECPVRKAARTGERVTMDLESVDAAGARRLLQVVATPIVNADGRSTLVVRQEHDVTEKRKVERALELRTRELERAHEELRTIFDAARQLGNAGSLAELVTAVLQTTRRILPSAELLLFVRSSDGSHFLSLEGPDPTLLAPLRRTMKRLEKAGSLSALVRTLDGWGGAGGLDWEGCHRLPAELAGEVAGYPAAFGLPLCAGRQCVGYFLARLPSAGGYSGSDVRFLQALLEQVAGSLHRLVLHEEVRALRAKAAERPGGVDLVGQSERMLEVYERIELVSGSDATVLITGENGTGKELVARAIHAESQRRRGPFVVANCSAYSPALLETELFGHERGAFTGAIKRRKGRIERAEGGTLFLDEIGEISPATQVLLLRFLQDHRFERVGGEQLLEADVRVVAATNKDLRRELEQGRFRDDLYYRLNVVTIRLPALRERRPDIPLLSEHFLHKHCQREGKRIAGFSPDALGILMNFDWPGNVRQLENAVSHAVILSREGQVQARDLPRFLRELGPAPQPASLAEQERTLISRALREAHGNKHEAARRLHVARSTLYSKLHRYGLESGVQDRDPGVDS